MNAALAWIENAAAVVGWASASAAVLIAGAWAMRRALGRRLGLGWRGALGWLVVVRLLCPVAPESCWSWRNWIGAGGLAARMQRAVTPGGAGGMGEERWSTGRGADGGAADRGVAMGSGRRPMAKAGDAGAGDLGGAGGEERAPSRENPGTEDLAPVIGDWPSAIGRSTSGGSAAHEASGRESGAGELTSLGAVGIGGEDGDGDEVAGPAARVMPVAEHGAPVVGFWTDVPWLAFLWCAGAIAVFSLAVARHLVFWGRVRRFSVPVPADSELVRWLDECRELMRMRPRVRLRTLDGLGSPVVFGLFRPFILLPVDVAGRLSAIEARHIFLHELAHIRCGDVAANWLLIATRALHWFDPLVWTALRQIVAERELRRDAMALRALPGGAASRRAYGHTLLRLATTLSRPRLSPGLASLIHTEKEIHRRIAMISSPIDTNRRLWPQAIACGLALALVAVTFTTAARGQAASASAPETKSADVPPPSLTATVADPAAGDVPKEIRISLDDEPRVSTAIETSITIEGGGDRLTRLGENEKRLADLDAEIAKMTAEGRTQEVGILTSLRGDLLKEIYRAKYLPPADASAMASASSKPVATVVRDPDPKKKTWSTLDSRTRADATSRGDWALSTETPVAELSALRAQVTALAAQIAKMQQQLDGSQKSVLENQLRYMQELGAGPAHPDIRALKALLDARKESGKRAASSRAEIEKKALRKLKEAKTPAEPAEAAPPAAPETDVRSAEPKPESPEPDANPSSTPSQPDGETAPRRN